MLHSKDLSCCWDDNSAVMCGVFKAKTSLRVNCYIFYTIQMSSSLFRTEWVCTRALCYPHQESLCACLPSHHYLLFMHRTHSRFVTNIFYVNAYTLSCMRACQNVSDDAKDLINKLLQKDPQKRLRLDKVIYRECIVNILKYASCGSM